MSISSNMFSSKTDSQWAQPAALRSSVANFHKNMEFQAHFSVSYMLKVSVGAATGRASSFLRQTVRIPV